MNEDIVIEEGAFQTASQEMAILHGRTVSLRVKMQELYKILSTALQTPAGIAFESVSEDIIVNPAMDLELVVKEISDLLVEISEEGCYKDVFVKFEELNESIKFN